MSTKRKGTNENVPHNIAIHRTKPIRISKTFATNLRRHIRGGLLARGLLALLLLVFLNKTADAVFNLLATFPENIKRCYLDSFLRRTFIYLQLGMNNHLLGYIIVSIQDMKEWSIDSCVVHF